MEIVQAEQSSGGGVRLLVPQQSDRADGTLRDAQWRDQRRPHAIGEPRRDGARIRLRPQVRAHQRLTGAHYSAGRAAVESENQSVGRCRGAQCGRDTQVLAVRLFERHERTLRLDQLHQALECVAQQELGFRRGEEPARELDHEAAEAALALQRGAPAHHDRQA